MRLLRCKWDSNLTERLQNFGGEHLKIKTSKFLNLTFPFWVFQRNLKERMLYIVLLCLKASKKVVQKYLIVRSKD